MTERRAILNMIKALEDSVRGHYRRMDVERIGIEAEEAQIKNLEQALKLTRRSNGGDHNDSRNESRDQTSSEVVSGKV